jgi:hypothetical protein
MKTIVLEDHGQDFLEWDVDDKGVVVGCRPFQERIWKGTKIINKRPRSGSVLKISIRKDLRVKGSPVVTTLKYRVESVRRVDFLTFLANNKHKPGLVAA